MTTQIPNTILYRDQHYCIADLKVKGLFKPAMFGIKVTPAGSMCWRGYVCHYAIQNQRLELDTLSVATNEPAPNLFGVKPEPPEQKGACWNAVYQDLRLPITYTGNLTIAKDYIEEMREQRAMQTAWKFKEVRTLTFKHGKLVSETDRSAEIAMLRQKYLAGKPASENQIASIWRRFGQERRSG